MRYGRKSGYLPTCGLSYLMAYNWRVLRGIGQSCNLLQVITIVELSEYRELIAPLFSYRLLKKGQSPRFNIGSDWDSTLRQSITGGCRRMALEELPGSDAANIR